MKNKYLIMIGMFLCGPAAFAQYSINADAGGALRNDFNALNIYDSVYTHAANPAEIKYQKRLIRQERNFFETKNSLYITQFSYSNWAEGGHNSFNGKIASQTKHVYKYKGTTVNSYLNMGYALGNQDEILQKTDDFFELNTDVSNQIWGRWYYSFGLNLKSQFTNTFDYTKKVEKVPTDDPDVTTDKIYYEKTLKSSFFAPGTLKPYAGVTYKLDDKRTIMLSPLSGNMVFVLDPELSAQGVFGVAAGKKFKANIGIYLNIQWEEKILKDGSLTYRTNIQSFYGYDFKGVPNFSWESWLDYTVFKYFNINLYAKFIYDRSIANLPKAGNYWQIKQSLGFGITYNFKNKEKP